MSVKAFVLFVVVVVVVEDIDVVVAVEDMAPVPSSSTAGNESRRACKICRAVKSRQEGPRGGLLLLPPCRCRRCCRAKHLKSLCPLRIQSMRACRCAMSLGSSRCTISAMWGTPNVAHGHGGGSSMDCVYGVEYRENGNRIGGRVITFNGGIKKRRRHECSQQRNHLLLRCCR